MEATAIGDIAVLLRECVSEMDVVEARFITECYLADPKMSLKEFSENERLESQAIRRTADGYDGPTPRGVCKAGRRVGGRRFIELCQGCDGWLLRRLGS